MYILFKNAIYIYYIYITIYIYIYIYLKMRRVLTKFCELIWLSFANQKQSKL